MRVRDRWAGVKAPAFGGPLEKWAVYVVETHKGRSWTVVGRLLQRPWCRVGGEGEMAEPGEPTQEAREWLQRQGLLEPAYWVPQGSLIIPDKFTLSDIKPYRPPPTTRERKYRFDSLVAARACGRRMADVLCPREQGHTVCDKAVRRI